MPSSMLTRQSCRRRHRFTILACSLLLATAGLVAPAGRANASSTISVAPTSLVPGFTFTITFTATRDFDSSQSGMGFYASGSPLGTLDSFTTVVSCAGPVAGPCTTLAGLGYVVPTGPVPLGTTVSGSLTLRIKPGTPGGSFSVRKQFGGEQTLNGPTVTVIAGSLPFAGFFGPVGNQPTVNAMSAGQTIPLKFSVGGYHGPHIITAGYPVSWRVDCNGGIQIGQVEQTVPTRKSSLTYAAASGWYTYVWKTSKAWANTCRTLDLRLTDGSHHLASFDFNTPHADPGEFSQS